MQQVVNLEISVLLLLLLSVSPQVPELQGARLQDWKGRTPLHYAAEQGHRDAVIVLVCAGAGGVELELAGEMGNEEVMGLLMEGVS